MAASRTLVLVRHGETEGQSSIRYFGRTDLALSELGWAQVRAAAAALAGRRFTLVFASPLQRAYQAARLIGGPSLPVSEIAEFVEVDFGIFEGLTADEIRERHPAEFARWNRDRLAPDFAYPQGESRAAFKERVERGLEKMLAAWETAGGGDALIVAHRGVIRTIVGQLTGAAPRIELASISLLECGDGGWRVTALDLIDHLHEAGLHLAAAEE